MIGNSTNTREVILGNITWWTGDHDALKRAVCSKEEIDFQVQQAVHDYPRHSLPCDQLSSNDWEFLEGVLEFLASFRNETLLLVGYRKQGSLHYVYPSMGVIRNHLLFFLSPFSDPTSHFHHYFNLAWNKLDKYSPLSNLSPMLCASIVLNPIMDTFFESSEHGWGNRRDWVTAATVLVRQHLQEKYRALALQPATIPLPLPQKSNLSSSRSSFQSSGLWHLVLLILMSCSDTFAG